MYEIRFNVICELQAAMDCILNVYCRGDDVHMCKVCPGSICIGVIIFGNVVSSLRGLVLQCIE